MVPVELFQLWYRVLTRKRMKLIKSFCRCFTGPGGRFSRKEPPWLKLCLKLCLAPKIPKIHEKIHGDRWIIINRANACTSCSNFRSSGSRFTLDIAFNNTDFRYNHRKNLGSLHSQFGMMGCWNIGMMWWRPSVEYCYFITLGLLLILSPEFWKIADIEYIDTAWIFFFDFFYK